MYNGIKLMEDVIDFIEENITSDIDSHLLSEKMSLSVYEFRRIFSFVVGVPLSEYVRQRRLSLAALEIRKNPLIDMLSLSEKYGYSTQSAFIKAFRECHGISPGAYAKSNSPIRLFTRPHLEFSISGGEGVELRFIEDSSFYIDGYVGFSSRTDTECCENVWGEFYSLGYDAKIEGGEIYAAYFGERDGVRCHIGERRDSVPLPKEEPVREGDWAVFTLCGTDDAYVNREYGKILYEYLPSANLKRDTERPIVEVFPRDMTEDFFSWEIRIPIIK